MKTKLILLLLLGWAGVVWGQENTIDIAKAKIVEKGEKIDSLNQRMQALNRELQSTRLGNDQQLSKLKDQLRTVEKAQKMIEDRELEIYQKNLYISLVSLHTIKQDLNVVNLLNSTKKFYSNLKSVGNPKDYPEFNNWLVGFKQEIERKKKKDANLYLLNLLLNEKNVLTLTNSIPTLSYFTTGISSYISSISENNKKTITEGQNMLILILKLEEFNKVGFENNEFLSTNKLQEIETLYNEILESQLNSINENVNDFSLNRKGSTNSILNYYTVLEEKSKTYVVNLKGKNPNWKSEINKLLFATQSFNSEFGTLLLKIKEEMDSYVEILKKYENDETIGKKVHLTLKDLYVMQKDFDTTYKPKQYLLNVNQMYLTPQNKNNIMKKHIILFVLLCFCNSVQAQKKQVNTKPQPTTVKPKTAIPDNFESISKLLQDGKITLYDAYNAQVDIINKIQKSTFNKQVPVQTENKKIVYHTILPVDSPVIFNLNDRSIAFITSAKSEKSEISKKIYPQIIFNLSSNDEIKILAYKEVYGEITDIIVQLPEATERVVLDDKGDIMPYPYTRKEKTVYFSYLSNDINAQKKLMNAIKNIILLVNSDVDSDNPNKKTQVTTTEDDKGMRIAFKQEN